jgi:hypothetical protein
MRTNNKEIFGKGKLKHNQSLCEINFFPIVLFYYTTLSPAGKAKALMKDKKPANK